MSQRKWIAGSSVRLALALCLSAATQPAMAQENPQIGVACSIRARALTALYGAATREVADGWCNELAERLEEQVLYPTLSLWRYVSEQLPPVSATSPAADGACDHLPDQGPAGGQSTARFHLDLCDGSAGETRVRLQLLLNDRQAGRWIPSSHWDGVWREPGDPSADPTEEEAPKIFAQALIDNVLKPRKAEITSQLKRVPLAQAQREPTEDSRIVSSLPWDSFQRLRCSTFAVLCRESPSGWRKLGCIAELVPMPYRPANEEPYDAVAAVAAEPGETFGSQLEPELLLLVDYREPDACDFAIFGGP